MRRKGRGGEEALLVMWLTKLSALNPPMVVSRAHTRSNIILKCFVSRDRTRPTLVKAFITYVRPLVEYASPVWSPGTLSAMDRIETVQRRFTKRILGLHSCSYHTRLTLLGIDSLEARRLNWQTYCMLIKFCFSMLTLIQKISCV